MARANAVTKRLVAALVDQGVFLADEPYLDWASPRGNGWRRCASRLVCRSPETGAADLEEPARSVSSGPGRPVSRRNQRVQSGGGADPNYSAHGHRSLAVTTYERCLRELEDLGLPPSPALERARRRALLAEGVDEETPPIAAPGAVAGRSVAS